MSCFEYDGPNNGGVTDRDTEMAFVRENMSVPCLTPGTG